MARNDTLLAQSRATDFVPNVPRSPPGKQSSVPGKTEACAQLLRVRRLGFRPNPQIDLIRRIECERAIDDRQG